MEELLASIRLIISDADRKAPSHARESGIFRLPGASLHDDGPEENEVLDLTDDLDGMYKQLMSFQAAGGGDEPESVNQALQDAVEKVS